MGTAENILAVLGWLRDKIWERFGDQIIVGIIGAATFFLAWARGSAVMWADVLSALILAALMYWMAKVARAIGARSENERMLAANYAFTLAHVARNRDCRKVFERAKGRMPELINGGAPAIVGVWWRNISARIYRIQWDSISDEELSFLRDELHGFMSESIRLTSENPLLRESLATLYRSMRDELMTWASVEGVDVKDWNIPQ
jgi:hypothetical protein